MYSSHDVGLLHVAAGADQLSLTQSIHIAAIKRALVTSLQLFGIAVATRFKTLPNMVDQFACTLQVQLFALSVRQLYILPILRAQNVSKTPQPRIRQNTRTSINLPHC